MAREEPRRGVMKDTAFSHRGLLLLEDLDEGPKGQAQLSFTVPVGDLLAANLNACYDRGV